MVAYSIKTLGVFFFHNSYLKIMMNRQIQRHSTMANIRDSISFLRPLKTFSIEAEANTIKQKKNEKYGVTFWVQSDVSNGEW